MNDGILPDGLSTEIRQIKHVLGNVILTSNAFQNCKSKLMIHLLGFAAIGINLLAMTMKNVLKLRAFSAAANLIYIIYGFLINAPPIIIGGAIAVIIHSYHIYKLIQGNKPAYETR